MRKPRVGIVGAAGIVGSSLSYVLEEKCILFKSDPAFVNSLTVDDLVKNGCEVIFICVPTPMSSKTGKVDPSILDSVMTEIDCALERHSWHNRTVVCIKSTVTPDVLLRLKDTFKKIHLTMSPEFLTEANSHGDMRAMKLLVVGGESADAEEVIDLFVNHSICSDELTPVVCSIAGASLVKYFINTFLALKVAVFNQFFEVWQKSGSMDDFRLLTEILAIDPRIGPSHMKVPGPDGQRGYGGKCFPKDSNAFIEFAKSVGVDPSILTAAWDYNLKVRQDQDWMRIVGAVSEQ